jgi:hypothetical protein
MNGLKHDSVDLYALDQWGDGSSDIAGGEHSNEACHHYHYRHDLQCFVLNLVKLLLENTVFLIINR